jgi:hypothetical protein
MAKNTLSTDFKTLQKFILDIFSQIDFDTIEPVVEETIQQNEINLLKQTLGGERFFFVIDMPSFSMQHPNGINKWLGYSEQEFTLKFYWDVVVHPAAKKTLLLVVMQMYQMLCSGKYPLEFMVQRFSTKIPLKHKNGHYLLTKKTSSIFQYDTQNRLLAYMDEFTIIGNYNGESAIEPRMYNATGTLELEKQVEILKKSIQQFLEMKIYSVNELQIARKLAYHPTISQTTLAKEFGVSKHTVNTYYKRFLAKTREFFHKTELELPTTLEAALFLKKEGLF